MAEFIYSNSSGSHSSKIDIQLPKKVVPDSIQATASVIGKDTSSSIGISTQKRSNLVFYKRKLYTVAYSRIQHVAKSKARIKFEQEPQVV